MKRQSREDFQESEDTLPHIIMRGACQYPLVQTHRAYSTQREPEPVGAGYDFSMQVYQL